MGEIAAVVSILESIIALVEKIDPNAANSKALGLINDVLAELKKL